MLKDSFGRTIDYLRVSITDLCNLHCIYCKPFLKKSYRDILRIEEIIEVIKSFTSLGIKKIRITGGEPLMRGGLPDFFKRLSRIDGEFFLTTNGVFLSDKISLLKDAGISRINVALPSLKGEIYKKITGFDELNRVLKGIKMARREGFFVKINVVLIKDINSSEIMDFVKFSKKEGIIVRFIEFMPVGITKWEGFYFPLNGIFNGYSEIKGKKGNGPARYYEIEGAIIGLISPLSKPFCSFCNRMRLTPDGKLRACLGDGYEIDLKTPLRSGKDISEFIKLAVRNKPEGWRFKDKTRQMSAIGG